ncbi:hypothetical protein LIER_22901 [Lithospermum erythrorhizon]|uniref:Reticulon-like protein n=1 Tax=Lithospermum erythrorhizon TaxID=34254 RepID=A0AAV3QY15_LITER
MNRKLTNGVVAGSVWESRMKIDEFKGGIMVFKSDETLDDSNSNSSPTEETIITNDNGISSATSVTTREQQIMDKRVNFKPKQSPPTLSAKRRTWKSDSIDVNQIHMAKKRSEMSKNVDEQCRELSVSSDGIKKSPIQLKKARSDANKELSASVDAIERTPFQRMKTRSVSQKGLIESSNSIEKTSVQLRKLKSESCKGSDDSSDGKFKNTLQMVRAKSVSSNDLDEKCKSSMVSSDQTVPSSFESRKLKLEKNYGIKRTVSDENFKDFGVCEEKLITSTLVKSEMINDHSLNDDEDWENVVEEEVDEEIKDEVENKSIVVRDMSISDKKPKMMVIEEKKHHQSNERTLSVSSVIVKKPQHTILRSVSDHPTTTKTQSIPKPEELQRDSQSHSRLDSFVDLIMWRDVSKSAFIFGVGTFVIISSSYTHDIKISVISVLSYISLVYLAAIFLFRSFINRGARDNYSTNKEHVVGEEEAIWLIKLILPYVNEFLLNIRALFSGDPSTTMKLAVLLFVLARCGSSITIWKMAKLGFFGVFIVPKVCSSYSSQITAFGKFWIRRFQDAWESCSHKKAVAFGVFTLVWNLSSIVARIWAVFMLFVAFKYYQQSLMGGECRGEETSLIDEENCWKGQLERQRKERRSMIMETRKQKKSL